MTPWEAEILQMLVAAAGGISFVWILTRFLLKRKELENQPGGGRMQRALDEVREEMEEMRTAHSAQLAEIHERIDFAERLLTEARGRPLLDGSENTPT
jgi:hypothetical protein